MSRALDEARLVAARQLDAARYDLGRALGRPLRPGIWLVLLAGAAVGFRAAESLTRGPRHGSRRARRTSRRPAIRRADA